MRVDSGTIYKTADERTDPVGGAFTLRDEYDALHRMHRNGATVPEPRGYDTDQSAYGMEHIDGTTLQDIATVDGELTAEEQEEIADQLEEDLEAMHEHGQPHGDICTSNIIINQDRTAYYIDPSGIQPEHPEADAVMERDRQNLAYITDRLL